MEENVLSIHTRHGEEKFEITHVSYNLYNPIDPDDYDEEDGEEVPDIWEFAINFEIGKTLQSVEKFAEHKRTPSMEITVLLTSEQVESLKKGSKYTQEEGYDRLRDEHLTNIYYFSHNNVDNITLEIVDISEKGLLLSLTGEALINEYGKEGPDGKLNALFWAKQDKNFLRTMS